jgi:predicted phage terminase large subunit-like protein
LSNAYELPPGFDTWNASTQRAYLARLKWLVTARPEQLAPEGEWENWLLLAGRGFGKTRTAAEDIAGYMLANSNSRIGIGAATFGDGRDTCIEGESGLLRCIPEEDVEVWNRSLGELILKNGSRGRLFTADQPDRLRGPQHHRFWADELAAWKNQDEMFAQIKLGLRLPPLPQLVITTTPRPTKLIKQLVEDSKTGRTVVTRGSTFDNAANLAASTLRELKRLYEGTRMGRQELYAEVLSNSENAIIKPDWWQPWDKEEYPEGDFTVASLDSAYTRDKENDASVLTVWRVYQDPKTQLTRILLIHAWKARLEFNDLVSKVIETSTKKKVDRIYVEGKANGISIIQELRRRTREQKFSVFQVNPDGDKIARAHACSSVFAAGCVFIPVNKVAEDAYEPATKWAQMVIDDCAEFPINGRDTMDSVSQGITQIRKLGLQLFPDEDAPGATGGGAREAQPLY